MTNETQISMTDLSDLTGYSVPHIALLVRRGILPPGEKRGKYRMLPFKEAVYILETHDPKKYFWDKKKTSQI